MDLYSHPSRVEAVCRPDTLDFCSYSSLDLDLDLDSHPSRVAAVCRPDTLDFSSYSSLDLDLDPHLSRVADMWRPDTLFFSSCSSLDLDLDLDTHPSRVAAVCRLLQLLQPGPGLGLANWGHL